MSKTAQIILDQMVLVKVEATIYGAPKKLNRRSGCSSWQQTAT